MSAATAHLTATNLPSKEATTIVDEQIDRLKKLKVTRQDVQSHTSTDTSDEAPAGGVTAAAVPAVAPSTAKPPTKTQHSNNSNKAPTTRQSSLNSSSSGPPTMSPAAHEIMTQALTHASQEKQQKQPGQVMPAPRQLPPFVLSNGYNGGRHPNDPRNYRYENGSQYNYQNHNSRQQHRKPHNNNNNNNHRRSGDGSTSPTEGEQSDDLGTPRTEDTTTPKSDQSHSKDSSTIAAAATSEKLDSLSGGGAGSRPKGPSQREVGTPCAFFLRTGSCAYGDRCKFDHPQHLAPKVVYNKLGLPLRPGEPDCDFYMKTFDCAYGHTCKYNHPEPPADTTTLNGNATAAVGAMNIPYPRGAPPPPGATALPQQGSSMMAFSPPTVVPGSPIQMQYGTALPYPPPYPPTMQYGMVHQPMGPDQLSAMVMAQNYYMQSMPQYNHHSDHGRHGGGDRGAPPSHSYYNQQQYNRPRNGGGNGGASYNHNQRRQGGGPAPSPRQQQ